MFSYKKKIDIFPKGEFCYIKNSQPISKELLNSKASSWCASKKKDHTSPFVWDTKTNGTQILERQIWDWSSILWDTKGTQEVGCGCGELPNDQTHSSFLQKILPKKFFSVFHPGSAVSHKASLQNQSTHHTHLNLGWLSETQSFHESSLLF